MTREMSLQKSETVMQSITLQSKWANRFVIAAIIQGALAAALTSYLLYQGVWGFPAASRIVAGGGAGTWLTVGYLVYIVLGPIATAVTALFYQHLEAHLHKLYTGLTNILAWIHLVLMNVGVVGGTWLMMNAGYRGGAAAMSVAQGGLGWSGANAGLVHSEIMVFYPPYIAVFIAIALVGAIAGGLGYVIAWRRTLKP